MNNEQPQVTVEPAVPWVLAEHFSAEEIAAMNELVAARNYDGLGEFIGRAASERNIGIQPLQLFDHLSELMRQEDMPDEEEHG